MVKKRNEMDNKKLETRLGFAIIICGLLSCATIILSLVVGFQQNKINSLQKKFADTMAAADSYKEASLYNQQQK